MLYESSNTTTVIIEASNYYNSYLLQQLLQQFVLDIPSLGHKHPVGDKFNEVHFLADVD